MMDAQPYVLLLEGPGKNALGTALMQSIRDRLRDADGRPVLMLGAGGAFSAGLDLKEVASLDGPGMERFLRLLSDLIRELYTYRGATVAFVNGHAIAGGCLLALCCDHRVAADDPRIRIGLNEVALGLRFPPVALDVVKARVPRRHWEAVVLAAALHDPASAAALGLLDEVSTDGEAVARAALARFASHPAPAYAASKADLRPLEASAEAERRFLADVLPVWTAPELRERIAKVLRR